MGVYSDLLANAKSWDSGEQTVGNDDTVAGDRIITKELKAFQTRQSDVAYPSGFAATDEIQSIAANPLLVTSGNFTLTITLRGQDAFTTANIAYDASAATIETAIDVAATAAAVTGWTNADISVALTSTLNAGALTLTYDGDSVDDTNQDTVAINDANLFSSPVGAESTSQEGVEPVDEVQQVPVFIAGASSGNYTLAFNVGAQAFTTANIAHDAVAAAVETAIDTSATGNAVPAWVNGDISVSDGPLTTLPLVLTFDGTSTAGTDATEVVIADVDLVGAGPGAESTPTPGVVAVDEVQQITQFGGAVDGGNYTLTLNMVGVEVTTANIVWNANAAAIETAIDTVSTGNVGGWTNGDVTVAGGDMNTATLNFTYDGTSVAGTDMPEIVLNDVDIANGTLGSESTLTPGVASVDEIQGVAVFAANVSSGNYTLTLNLNSTAVTTDSILYNDNAGTIESAIDTVATGNVADWVNGDVSVSGGGLDAATVNLTYDGANYAGADQVQATIADVDLVGGVPATPITLTPGVAAIDETQTIAVFVDTVTSGNYTLEFTMSDLTNVTTANLAHDANAATIETAIDTVMTGNYGGWTNGDITIAGGPLTTNAVTLTYDGASVDELNHAVVEIASVDLAGHTTTGAESVTTYGQTDRTAFAAMESIGLLAAGGPPPQGTVAGITAAMTRNSSPTYPSQETLKALAMQASIEDGSDDVYTTLMTTFGLGRLL